MTWIKTAHRAEGNLHLKGVTLHARAQAAEMRSAIGQVADELQRQVIKRRDKIRGHRKVGTPTIRLAGAPEEV